jgi:hypothetical protein
MGSKSKKDVKILVVDNNRQLTDAIVEMLSRSGYSVTGAYGGMEGEIGARPRFPMGTLPQVQLDLAKKINGTCPPFPMIKTRMRNLAFEQSVQPLC